MRSILSMVLGTVLFAGCAAKPPSYVVVPRATSRSEEPVTLPLTPEGRERLENFLNHAGHPKAADPTPDPAAAEHRRVLDALTTEANLSVDTTNPANRLFCDVASALCRATALFQGKPMVRQVIDAREARRPVSAPVAVADGGYWWVFKAREGRLTDVLLVVSIDREVER